MAYAAQLINRLQQFGRVNYDLVVTDDANVLPTRRSAVSWPVADDDVMAPLILSAAPTDATQLLRDAEIASNILAALEQRNVTFDYSTPTQNITAVRQAYATMSQFDAVRMGNYISSLGLTNAQYTNFFGYSGAALTAFKARLATAVTNYNAVIATRGE